MNRHKQEQPGSLKSPLVKEERLSWILDRLARQGKVLATELTAALGVSEDTVRRDLRELAAARQVLRVHGGALRPSPPVLTYAARAKRSVPEKKSIGRAAARLVQPGMVVFMDGGTTNVHAAESLAIDLAATIVTNSIPVAMVLSSFSSVNLVLVGGKVLGNSRVSIGPEAIDAIRCFRADLFLLGTCSLDFHAGITAPHVEEAPVKRAMIAASQRVAGLVTGEKLGTATTCVVGSATDLDLIVTGHDANADLLAPFLQSGIEVIRGEQID